MKHRWNPFYLSSFTQIEQNVKIHFCCSPLLPSTTSPSTPHPLTPSHPFLLRKAENGTGNTCAALFRTNCEASTATTQSLLRGERRRRRWASIQTRITQVCSSSVLILHPLHSLNRTVGGVSWFIGNISVTENIACSLNVTVFQCYAWLLQQPAVDCRDDRHIIIFSLKEAYLEWWPKQLLFIGSGKAFAFMTTLPWLLPSSLRFADSE